LSKRRKAGRDALQADHAATGQRQEQLAKGAQEIYKEASNSAEDQYGGEDRAHRMAWSAVEQKYEKNDKGNWVQKDG
jgi:cation transport regulator